MKINTKKKSMKRILIGLMSFGVIVTMVSVQLPTSTYAAKLTRHKSYFPSSVYGIKAKQPNIFARKLNQNPLYSAQLMSPNGIKKKYGLNGSNGGTGTIAIVDVGHYATASSDLHVFSQFYGLKDCTTGNGCLTVHECGVADGCTTDTMPSSDNYQWTLETALDLQWAHAIAPNSKILLIEVPDNSATNLFSGTKYSNTQTGVVATSMSWGLTEFSDESTIDSLVFTSSTNKYFAATGDNGHTPDISYPAASPKVIAVGGTTLGLKFDGSLKIESAWSGSGGGISKYESEPSYQTTYGITNTGNMRSIPDVSLNSDPNTGYPIYATQNNVASWMSAGGTSIASPIWAAIEANSVNGFSIGKLYADAKSVPAVFRDITTGNNGTCGALCNAVTGYDFTTGLGVPATYKY